ncbi:hypothetical protein D3C72_1548050 [compost metagenome]
MHGVTQQMLRHSKCDRSILPFRHCWRSHEFILCRMVADHIKQIVFFGLVNIVDARRPNHCNDICIKTSFYCSAATIDTIRNSDLAIVQAQIRIDTLNSQILIQLKSIVERSETVCLFLAKTDF